MFVRQVPEAMSEAMCKQPVPDRVPLRLRPEAYHLFCIELPGHTGPHQAAVGEKDWGAGLWWLDHE